MITSLLVKYGTKTQLIFYLVHLKTQNKIKISKSQYKFKQDIVLFSSLLLKTKSLQFKNECI